VDGEENLKIVAPRKKFMGAKFRERYVCIYRELEDSQDDSNCDRDATVSGEGGLSIKT
jgi:hypothetical protein